MADVAQAKRSVDESRIAIAWENTTPSECEPRRNGLGAGLTHPFSLKSLVPESEIRWVYARGS